MRVLPERERTRKFRCVHTNTTGLILYILSHTHTHIERKKSEHVHAPGMAACSVGQLKKREKSVKGSNLSPHVVARLLSIHWRNSKEEIS